MSTRFIIQKDNDGVPVFFSAKVGRSMGAADGWVSDRDEALAFSRMRDVEEFIAIFLPHVGPFCTPVRYQAEEVEA